MREETESSEKLYDSLTKAFRSTYWVIRYVVYPATTILVIILGLSIWWGLDIKRSKSEISSTKQEIENIHKSLSLTSREIEISAKELQVNTKERFEEVAAQFTKFESDFKQMNSAFQDLKNRYEELLKELKADNKSLAEFSNAIKKSISEYTDEIAYARKGVEQRKKDIESILKKRNEQLEAIQKSTVLLLEYLVLMQSKSNVFPNPNIKKGIDILNKILVTLVPDEKERAAIVTRIKESIKNE